MWTYVHNHVYPSHIPYHKMGGKPPQEEMFVLPTIGKVYYHRVEACLRCRDQISCHDSVLFEPVYDENTLLKCGDQLISNVRNQRKELGLSGK